MSEYELCYGADVSQYVKVFADSLEEAEEKAEDLLTHGVCGHCASTLDMGDMELRPTYSRVDGKPIEVER